VTRHVPYQIMNVPSDWRDQYRRDHWRDNRDDNNRDYNHRDNNNDDWHRHHRD